MTAARQLTELSGLQDRATFVEGNADTLPFETGSFDGGISLYVGMNLPDREAVLREAARVIKPGGRLVWSEAVLKGGLPHYPLPWAAVPENSFLVSETALIRLFEKSGFQVTVNDETSAHIELARQRAASGIVPTAAHREANEVVLGNDLLERRKSYIGNLVEGRLVAIVISARRTK
ncbi:MAG: methyltransferase domain-containing protein [Neoaquamicrobium sediminum]|uniref:methyltransferase domain-containing protein n=1 Tax=Neoaquamicrobium sediminum TaxID=1849104 RepID=UPI004037E958